MKHTKNTKRLLTTVGGILACVGVVVWYSFPLLPLVATLFLVGGMLCILEAHD